MHHDFQYIQALHVFKSAGSREDIENKDTFFIIIILILFLLMITVIIIVHKILPVATGRSGIEAGDMLLPGKNQVTNIYIYIYIYIYI